jgi:hypothetical protein
MMSQIVSPQLMLSGDYTQNPSMSESAIFRQESPRPGIIGSTVGRAAARVSAILLRTRVLVIDSASSLAEKLAQIAASSFSRPLALKECPV